MNSLWPILGLVWVRMMAKKIISLIVITGMLIVLMQVAAVQADNGIRVVNISVEMTFPYQIIFEIETESDSEIIDIRLHYQVKRDQFAVVTSEIITDFHPSNKIVTNWKWDMRKSGGLPAGTIIEYWWTVRNIDKETIQTEISNIQFNDERYSWRSISNREITIYWYHGGEDFAWQLLETAQTALDGLQEDTGAHLQEPVSIYIYANVADLQGSMIFPHEWTGGVAFTTYGTVAIGISPNNLEWGRRTIVHELTHLVTQQMTYNPYNSVPVWLNEGLSMYAEGDMQPVFESYLKQAVLSDELITVRSLASPFSADTELSYLAYAQSMSIVDFLIDNYGHEKILELLYVFRVGSSYNEALTKVYGFDMGGLNDRWFDYIFNLYRQALIK
ncbi:MAG: peptidase MA domain-containing protein [Dehalococcoidia bacterium]|nr:MAG: peptidase MA domain-containing protein [Dehalococcoidia bacterium]